MILYFSATGNNRFVATELAKRLDDHAVSIAKMIDDDRYEVSLAKGERLGFAFPTYFYGFPSIVSEFLQKLSGSSKGHYVYLVASYGSSPGATPTFAKKLLDHSGITIDAFFCIRMPDTWTPGFDLSDRDAVRRLNQAEPEQIDAIAEKILSGSVGNFMEHQHSYPVSKVAQGLYDGFARKTSHLSVGDSCIGCGLCAKRCPVQAIEMRDDRPVWVKERCVMCLRCLHSCPKFAIQYDKKTRSHGQYTHPTIVDQDN
ncbi:EFR1 family ferrodoxin [Tractidigestivibacter sp.]|uniref:EFR1 family ferrodoxin n=1 Tax=Tractidigestivibacter sp. TaxID=2847320 RepID=UPI003D8F62A3